MSDDLVERLYEQADRRHGSIGSLRALEWEAADRIQAQEAEIRSLREQVARARLEGAEIMRKHVVVDLKSYGLDVAEIVRQYDPAAILEAHTRAKAMNYTPVGDSDGDDGA